MMAATSGRLVWSFFVAMTLLIVVAVATHNLARHHHRHHHQRQQDQPSSMPSHYYTSRHTPGFLCDDVCELHKSVQSLAVTQQDYGRALHAVYGLVDTVRREVDAIR